MTVVTTAPAEPAVRSERAVQLTAAGVLIGTLAVLGAVLGPVWEALSPAGPAGAVLTQGIQADETEAFIGGDGRFTIIALIVGLVAGLAAWYVPLFKRARGPYVAIGLVIGAVVGSALTEWLGYLVRGTGNSFACNSATQKCIDHLPLTVHMHALLLIEATVAALVYSLFVAFAVADDLGRPDPGRTSRASGGYTAPPVAEPVAAAWPPPAPVGYPAAPPSVGTEGDLQQPWRHGDAAGPA
jgi:uncharacterized membrane protein YeaQ/YmgE (transglycosylase-associated protein family)